MGYRLDLGAWGSVFAVPSELVDRHIKLAGTVQLKTILYLLRHAGEELTPEIISAAIGHPVPDVRDSMLYWESMGLVCINESAVTPPPVSDESPEPVPAVKPAAVPVTTAAAVKEEKPAEKQEEPPKKTRALSRPEKPDHAYLSRRMAEDEGIAYLMRSADEIFGRLTSVGDKATLLLIHETDGLPVDVIIMLLQYAKEIDKCNMRYIEKLAISWSEEEINTLERAERKIRNLTEGRSAAGRIQRLFGLDSHSPTEKEAAFAQRWVCDWGFSDDVIRFAYELCVDVKQKYIPKYVDTILARWASQGIHTIDEARQENEKGKGKKKKEKGYGTSFDINEFFGSSFDDEE